MKGPLTEMCSGGGCGVRGMREGRWGPEDQQQQEAVTTGTGEAEEGRGMA